MIIIRKDCCVIIPTIRHYEDCIGEYVKNARENNFDLDRLEFVLITEDFCDINKMKNILKNEGVSGKVFDKTKRTEWFKQKNIENFTEIIPQASHAETSFGLLYLWANPHFKYGFFIDDDTIPDPKFDFFDQHLKNLEYEGKCKTVKSGSNWVNVLYQNFERHKLYPRGYPYSAMNENIEILDKEVSEIVVSQGLWTHIPDLDAVRILMDGNLKGQACTHTKREDYKENFIVDKENYLTTCSMNLSFKRDVIPAFYQLPMDDNPWKIGRFDDIWSGVFLKKICDLLNKQIITTFPLCIHNKTPRSTFKNLNKEVAGLELNEYLWKIVNDLEKIEGFDDGYKKISEKINEENRESSYLNGEFLSFMSKKMKKWTQCIKVLKP